MISLSQVSNLFMRLVLPFFKTIQLSPLDNVPTTAPRRLIGYRILIFMQDPLRATIVTNLHIKLSCLRPSYLPHAHMDGKYCTRLDIALGKTLHYMVNLESLHINCDLCIVYERHRYLARLVIPQLRDLSVICRCGLAPGLDHAQWNEFPIFDTVEAFRWSIIPSRHITGPYRQGKFTKLKALEYHGGESERSLLEVHPIQRLLFDSRNPGYDPRLIVALARSPGALTHLIFQYSLTVTKAVPHLSSYLDKLQHIGTLPDFALPNTVSEPKACDSLLKWLLRRRHYNSTWAH
ncbi:hypothetical protein M408DRAFT_147269 [Serendipita vermifera MAFF 305830]|uniref:Uncharacterized protein n=1 Tax=Serendipita vermifera MAFF 305830 TaxID=933852 RepID=A0A0C2WP57_SERVB|nr:hypothetical protein M408DRAFT_147269 [Serendipita vermifera MAFF 305830]